MEALIVKLLKSLEPNTTDKNVVMLYSRRCLELIVGELCESQLGRPRKTEPLKGIIDKLNKEEKVPGHIITSMLNLNSLSTYGAHPKEFDPVQVKPVLNDLSTVLNWYIKFAGIKELPQKDTAKTNGTYPEKKSLKKRLSESKYYGIGIILVTLFFGLRPTPLPLRV